MESTKNLMYHITKHASLFLLLFAALTFISLMVFKIEFWLIAFNVKFPAALAWAMAVGIAIIVEGTRFSLMVSSAEDIAKGHKTNFWLGMLGSIALLIYEVFYMASEIGTTWSDTDDTYTNLFKFLAVLGMLLELRLCLLMNGSKRKAAPKEDKEEEININDPGQTNQSYSFNLGKYFGAKNSTGNASSVK